MNINDIYNEVEGEVKKVKFKDGVEVEVLKYLPLAQKYELVKSIVNTTYGEKYEPVLSYVSYRLYMIDYYSDIDFTDMDVSSFEMVDFLDESGLGDLIIEAIPTMEKDFIEKILEEEFEEKVKKEDSLINSIVKGLKTFQEEIGSLDDDTISRMKEVLNSVEE